MPENEDLLGRMTAVPDGRDDKLVEILNPQAGGEAKRLGDKLAQLSAAHYVSDKDESVARMKARNTALRLARGVKSRYPDRGARANGRKPAKRVAAYSVISGGKKLRLSLCSAHLDRLRREHPTLKISDAPGRVKAECEACGFKKEKVVGRETQ